MRKTTALWALSVLLLAGPSPAQEDDLPPPRRGAPDRAPQRGERLRKLAAPNGPLSQFLNSLAGDAAGNQQTPLEIPKLNDGIIELIKPLLDGDRSLESLTLRFDPADTNLARDTAHLVGAARMRHSRWSNDPSQIDFDLRANMQRRDDGRPQGTLDGDLHIQTDVVALADRIKTQVAERLERRAQQGAVRDGPLNADENFRLRMREKLAAMPPLENMDDVVDLILLFAGLRLTAINERIAELKLQSETGPDEKAKLAAAKQLLTARRERDQLLELRPRVERDDDGHAVAMRLGMDRSQVDETTRVERLKIDITATDVSLRGVGSTMQGMEIYALFKPLVMNTLTRIQARDPNTMQLGRGMFRSYLGQLRGAMGDAAEDTLPPPKPDPPAASAPPPAPPPASPPPPSPARKK